MKDEINIVSKLLLTPEDFIPSFDNWKVEGVFNPGAVRLKDKRIMLYVRVAESVIGKKGELCENCKSVLDKLKL